MTKKAKNSLAKTGEKSSVEPVVKKKVSDKFEDTIEDHLKILAFRDPLFAEKLKNPKKNISDCVTYILNTVKNSGKQGFTDDEVFGMAIHYYDEDDIEVGSKISTKVVVNHQTYLTDDEIAVLKQKAREEVINEEKSKMRQKTSVKSIPEVKKNENTLF